MSQIINLQTKIKVVVDPDNIRLFDKDSIQVSGVGGHLVISERSLLVPQTQLVSLRFGGVTFPKEDTLSDLCETVQGYLDNVGIGLKSDIPVSRYLDTNGDGTGTVNAIGDYSAAATEFFYAPAAGTYVNLHSIQYYIQDAGDFLPNDYGAMGLVTGLTNGYDITIKINGTNYNINPNGNIKDNGGLLALSAYSYFTQNSAERQNALISDSKIYERFSDKIILNGDLGDKVTITLNDSFTALIKHTFRVTGSFL